ncbi:tetratricopeptide repeat protein, partial [Streptomyces sp. NPDC090106]|uniref:tetratricopeptide repeat protein n=1 Tax=Streptomyces sp. NPDC090106 TaxID=3365946 RepID=UPI0038126E0A
MEWEQVVAVDGPAGPGSGYVIAGGLVLTSAHVVPPVGGTVRVYRPGRPDSWQAVVVWRGTPGGRDDAALLRTDSTARADAADSADAVGLVPVAGVRWGRLVTQRPGTVCEVWGVPEVVQQDGRATDTLQLSGTINPGDRRVGNRYVMNLTHHPPAARTDGTSPWGGMSGAALFCGGLLAGVVTSDPAGRRHSVLEAVPAYVLLHEPGFRSALAEHRAGIGLVQEPVEWQDLAEPPEPATGPLRSPAALLRARRQVVPFRGRTTLLDQLAAWAGEPGFGALLLHGPGGQGKTRLAQHFTDRQNTQRWAVLWLRADTNFEELAVLADAAVPALVVVDYAETRTAQLATLLKTAARHPGNTPFKLLLLARTAGDWWTALHAATPTGADILDGTPVLSLPPLEPEPGNSRALAYEEAVDGFARHLPDTRGWEDHDWPDLAHRLTSRPDQTGSSMVLDSSGPLTALTLHMTALADLLDLAQPPHSPTTPTAASPGPGQSVEDRLLLHERHYWTTSAATRTPQLPGTGTLTDALTAAFLVGAATREQADTLLQQVPGLHDQPHDARRSVREWITSLYPPTVPGRPWDTLQPDRLAEHFIGHQLDDHPELAHHLARDLTQEQAQQLLTVYARTATHTVFDHRLDPHLTLLCVEQATTLAPAAITVTTQAEAPAPLLTALQQISNAPGTSQELLEQLADDLPRTSHRLANWAAHLAQRITDHHRHTAQHNAERLPDLAMSLNNLSVRLGELGSREEALEAISEAVVVYRRLAEQRPDAFLPNLASSLNNLSVDLGELGSREKALEASAEAVTIQRRLAEQRPDAFLPDLAMSLNNLSVRLGELGSREEALEAISEAVVVYRRLAEQRPDAFLPNLASGLNNLSIRLGELGSREKALEASAEAVTIQRRLAEQRPDAFLPNLASGLNNLSNRLGELGSREKALEASAEAVTIQRRLAEQRPDAFLPNLASGLNNLSNRLGELGSREKALEASAEAVTIQRRLAEQRPDAFLPNLASSLNNLSNRLGELGSREEALEAISEAVVVYRRL